MMLYPPRPNNISIPAVVAGNILQSDDTSISVIDSGNDGSVVIRTQNKLAVLINTAQQTLLNTENATGMLNVNTDIAGVPALRLSYQDNRYFDTYIGKSAVGFTLTADDKREEETMSFIFYKDLSINTHDGATKGLKLGGTLVTASASELNYVDVLAGTAAPSKALVLDENSNVKGINRLDTVQLTGTLLTGPQPNITSLATVNISNQLSIHGVPFEIDLRKLGYLDLPNAAEGVAFASKALIADANKNIISLNRVVANSLTGVLTSGPQPNITSLSSLQSLVNNGPTILNQSTSITSSADHLILRYDSNIKSVISTSASGDMVLKADSNFIRILGTTSFQIAGHDGTRGLILGNTLVYATANQLNYIAVTPGTAGTNQALVLDTHRNIGGINTIIATYFEGTIKTETQPFIISVNKLDISSHNGSSIGLSLGGTLVTATALKLNYVDTTPGAAQALKALVLNTSKSITGISNLSADTVGGVLMTAAQPNIASVRTLAITDHNGVVGLSLNGVVVTASANQLNYVNVTEGAAKANKALILNDSKDIYGIRLLSVESLQGTLLTPAQPNITSVTTLNITNHNGSSTGLALSGSIITATADQLNYTNVTQGVGYPRKALVLDVASNIAGINVLIANTLTGTLTVSNQPNIKIVKTLNIADHNGIDVGLALNGTLVTATANQLNYVTVAEGVASPSKALIVDNSRNIANIGKLTATQLVGTIMSSDQPNITSVNRLNIVNHDGSTNGLFLNGSLVTATANDLNSLAIRILGVVEPSRVVTANAIRNIENVNLLKAISLEGVITTNSQPNITSVNTLNVINHNGTIGLALSGTLITASAQQINRVDVSVGIASAGKVMVLDSLRNITNINDFVASTLTGTLLTENQPYVTTVNKMNISNHDGGSDGLRLKGSLVTATASQLNYTNVAPGTAVGTHALVTDQYNSIAGMNSLSAEHVSCNSLSLTGIVSNFNVGALVMKTYSFTNMVGRMINIQLVNSLSFSNFQPVSGMSSGFSCEIMGYILPPYSENYIFSVVCNDRVRLWVNGTLILHSWVISSTARSASSIFLNANQWVPIYIQYQVDLNSSQTFSLFWQSSSLPRNGISYSNLAWDNNAPSVSSNMCSHNSFTILNTATNSQNTAVFTVDTGGDLTIDASGNDISLGMLDSLNIPSHDGTKGLMLGGVLVQPTAYELNYLKVSPGKIDSSHAVVVDASKSITGINSLSATSILCTNLTTTAFTIDSLTLTGPLNNYNQGSLLIRQITGANANGRVVHVNTISDLNFTFYDPRQLNSNYSLVISGYIKSTYSDSYKFYATASGYVRIFVNKTLVLNAYSDVTNFEYVSTQIFMTAGEYVPFYVQFQNVSTSTATIASQLQIRWASLTAQQSKTFISSANMAWDNTSVEPPRAVSCADQMVLFSTGGGLQTAQTGAIAVDSGGNLNLSATAGTVAIPNGNDLNIVNHNGTSRGLRLNGTLVTASAAELNYLAGAVPGSFNPGKAIVLSDKSELTGFTLLGGTQLAGTLTTNDQPNIKSLGTLRSTLNTTADVVLTQTNLLRLAADTTACYIQAGASSTTDSSADLFIGNYGASSTASSRKLMIKASGFVGVQTNSPTRTLTINGAGSTYCLRLVNNSSTGTETTFFDIGVNSSSKLVLSTGGSGNATIGVSSTGVLKFDPSGIAVQIGNTTNQSVPLEVGSTTFSLPSNTAIGYINSSGNVGAQMASDSSYSLRTTASIIVNGTVCVTSDLRLKENIESLAEDTCRRFVMDSKPIRFTYAHDSVKSVHCGLIAQDIAKTEFAELIRAAPYPGLEETESHGFISPADAALNISYDEIIPIIMTALKTVIADNEKLKAAVSKLQRQLEK